MLHSTYDFRQNRSAMVFVQCISEVNLRFPHTEQQVLCSIDLWTPHKLQYNVTFTLVRNIICWQLCFEQTNEGILRSL